MVEADEHASQPGIVQLPGDERGHYVRHQLLMVITDNARRCERMADVLHLEMENNAASDNDTQIRRFQDMSVLWADVETLLMGRFGTCELSRMQRDTIEMVFSAVRGQAKRLGKAGEPKRVAEEDGLWRGAAVACTDATLAAAWNCLAAMLRTRWFVRA